MMNLEDIEFSNYSQNGEDGILQYLMRGVLRRYFVEFGCGSGKENNTTNLAAQGFSGLAVDAKLSRIAEYIGRKERYGWDVDVLCTKVTREVVPELMSKMRYHDPDVFSLDIDSIDFWVMKELLERGFYPRIACVEYNAGFLDKPLTVTYNNNYKPRLHKHLDFGAGVAAWRLLFNKYGYNFVTVDSAGVNAFFIRGEVPDGVRWLDWADCRVFAEIEGPAEKRFSRMRKIPLVDVSNIL